MDTQETLSPENREIAEALVAAKTDRAKDFRWLLGGLVIFILIVGVSGFLVYLKMVDSDREKSLVVTEVKKVPDAVVAIVPTIIPKKAKKIEVLNGSGVVGAAKVVGEKLKSIQNDLEVITGNNKEDVSENMVIYKSEEFKAGDFSGEIKTVLVKFSEKIDTSLTVDVRIVLGK